MSIYVDVEVRGTKEHFADVHFVSEPQVGDTVSIAQHGNWLRVTGRRHEGNRNAYSIVKLTVICEPISKTEQTEEVANG